MVGRLPAGPSHWPATATLISWGAVEMALQLRLALRVGWRGRLRTWSAAVSDRLHEWTFFVL